MPDSSVIVGSMRASSEFEVRARAHVVYCPDARDEAGRAWSIIVTEIKQTGKDGVGLEQFTHFCWTGKEAWACFAGICEAFRPHNKVEVQFGPLVCDD